LDRPDSIGGGHALLVDDVWTTGATTLACADALLLAGARAVSVVTFARALPEIERHSRRLDSLVKP
jgi:predicted amidophosphoribosyltransferase